jgi:predicted alpha/beta superfamily hydrolase
MKKILSALILMVSLNQLIGQQVYPSKTDSIYSSILEETRRYQLYLPPTYDQYETSKKYPLVIILDGDRLFQVTAGNMDFLSKTGKIPESIILGLSNTNRVRDFTPTISLTNYEGQNDNSLKDSGGAEKFLQFLQQELIQEIDQKYRTNRYIILIGHSLAGLFGSYVLTTESMIKGFVLIDPSLWWDNEIMSLRVKEVEKIDRTNSRIYLSSADNFDLSSEMERMRNSQENFMVILKKNGLPNNNLNYKIFENENHGTIPLKSIIEGIEFIFDGYFIEGMKYKKSKEIIDSFKRFDDRMGVHFPALEAMINWLASRKLKVKDYQEGIELLEMNYKNYPDSWKAKYNLGLGYEQMGDKGTALKYYQEALKINPENQTINEKVNQ